MSTEVLTKFLVPLDIKGHYSRTAGLVKCIAVTLGQHVEKITLLHVNAGSYLAQHMANIDFRAGHLLSTDKFRELRQKHIEQEVMPEMEKVKEDLVAAGVTASIEIEIKDGDPVDKIVQTVNEGNYTSLFLQRSDDDDSIFAGSVTSGILHREINATIYLAPAEEGKDSECPPKNCIVAIDGSKNSMAALERARVLASASGDSLEKIVLSTVLDMTEYSEAIAEGKDPEAPDSTLLDKAADELKSAGIPEEKIVESITCGEPADVITGLVKRYNADMIFMGRRDRGAIKELFMGSVSSKVIRNCPAQVIVLANGN